MQEAIDGEMLSADQRASAEAKLSIAQEHGCIRRHDVNAVRGELHAILHFDYRNFGGTGKNLREHAGMRGIQVLDEDKRHPGVFGKMLQHLRKSFEPTRRSPDAYDGEGILSWSRLDGRLRNFFFRSLFLTLRILLLHRK